MGNCSWKGTGQRGFFFEVWCQDKNTRHRTCLLHGNSVAHVVIAGNRRKKWGRTLVVKGRINAPEARSHIKFRHNEIECMEWVEEKAVFDSEIVIDYAELFAVSSGSEIVGVQVEERLPNGAAYRVDDGSIAIKVLSSK